MIRRSTQPTFDRAAKRQTLAFQRDLLPIARTEILKLPVWADAASRVFEVVSRISHR